MVVNAWNIYGEKLPGGPDRQSLSERLVTVFSSD